MENDIKTILNKLEGLGSRFATLEQSVDEGFKEMERSFKDTSESIAGVVTMVSERFDTVTVRLDRIEQSVTTHAMAIDHLTDDVRLLKTKAGIS